MFSTSVNATDILPGGQVKDPGVIFVSFLAYQHTIQ